MTEVPSIFFHLKLVARISLAVGAFATLVLIVGLLFITGGSGESYGAIIRSHSLTGDHLGLAMLSAGLVIVAVTGLMTWMIVLYSSVRVAGPLYRFCQNLKLATASDSIALIELRKGDALTRHAVGIKTAISTLREHYAATQAASDQALSALGAGDAAQYADAIARLKTLDEKIRV